MPTLTINGRDVDVGDEFLKLSPEQQNATVDEIAHSMGVGKSTQSDATPSGVDAVGDALGGAALSATHGVPIVGGLVDKGIAGLSALGTQAWDSVAPASLHSDLNGSLADRYSQSLNHVQGQEQQFQANHPNIDRWAPAVGAIASTAPIAPYGLLGMAQGPGLLSALGRAAITGTEGGIIGGADAKIRGQDPLAAAIIGSMGGAGGSLLGDALGAGWRALTTSKAQRAEQYGARYVDNILGEKRAEIAKLLNDDPNSVVADYTQTGQQKLSQMRDIPGPQQDQIKNFFNNRAAGTLSRSRSAINDAASTDTNLFKFLQDTDAARKAAASGQYDEAFSKPFELNETLKELIDRPSVQDALKEIPRLAREQSLPPPNLDQIGLPELHLAQQVMRQNISKLYKADASFQGGLEKETRNALMKELDRQVPEYTTARNTYAGHSTIMDAAEEGRQFLKGDMSPDKLVFQLNEMSDSERDAFRIGARQALLDRIGNMPAKNTQAAGNAGVRTNYNVENVYHVFGKDEGKRLLDSIDRENMYADTNKAVTGGSPTTFKLGRESSGGFTDVLKALMSGMDGNKITAAGHIASALSKGASKLRSPAQNQAITDALLRNSLADARPTPSIAPTIAALLVGGTLPAERQ